MAKAFPYKTFRREKDDFFASNPHSPLTPNQRKDFDGLAYFPVNDALRFTVAPQPFADPQPITMQTSTGDVQTYLRWARVSFTVNGEDAALTVYSNQHGLFLPFVDATSGSETYGAGRYLEPEQRPDGTLLLDFNQAYNPYCAYNDMYSCPIPPMENRIAVRIAAGEKNPAGAWAGKA